MPQDNTTLISYPNMTISKDGEDFIKDFEQLRLVAYKDQRGTPTIGWGNTKYQNLKPVRLGDEITRADADALYAWALKGKGGTVDTIAIALKSVRIKQGCFDMLCSLTYNIGRGSFLDSTILKKVLVNVNDETIPSEFLKWCKITVDGKLIVSNGLLSRRKTEAKNWNVCILSPVKNK